MEDLTSAEKYHRYIEQYRIRKYNYTIFAIEKAQEFIDLMNTYIDKEREIYEIRTCDHRKRKESMERELKRLEEEKRKLEINQEAYPMH